MGQVKIQVINDYPGMSYEKNEVLEYNPDEQPNLISEWRDACKKYPHLYREINNGAPPSQREDAEKVLKPTLFDILMDLTDTFKKGIPKSGLPLNDELEVISDFAEKIKLLYAPPTRRPVDAKSVEDWWKENAELSQHVDWNVDVINKEQFLLFAADHPPTERKYSEEEMRQIKFTLEQIIKEYEKGSDIKGLIEEGKESLQKINT